MGVNADTDGSGKDPFIINSACLDSAAASLHGIHDSGSSALLHGEEEEIVF